MREHIVKRDAEEERDERGDVTKKRGLRREKRARREQR